MSFPNNDSVRNTIEKYCKKKKIEYSENSFLSILENDKSGKNDVYMAVIGLRDVGTEKSIEPLKKLLHYPKQDVKDCSILTVCHIAHEKETDYYIEALLDKKTKKDYPMWAILDSADEKANEAVIQYLSDVYKKWKQPKCEYAGSAFLDGLLYLDRFFEKNSDIEKIFQLYKNIRNKIPQASMDRLKNDTKWLNDILFNDK